MICPMSNLNLLLHKVSIFSQPQKNRGHERLLAQAMHYQRECTAKLPIHQGVSQISTPLQRSKKYRRINRSRVGSCWFALNLGSANSGGLLSAIHQQLAFACCCFFFLRRGGKKWNHRLKVKSSPEVHGTITPMIQESHRRCFFSKTWTNCMAFSIATPSARGLQNP